MSIQEAECGMRAPGDVLFFGSFQCHVNRPAHKRAGTRHNDLQEMPIFKHCFMSWDPAFKYLSV